MKRKFALRYILLFTTCFLFQNSFADTNSIKSITIINPKWEVLERSSRITYEISSAIANINPVNLNISLTYPNLNIFKNGILSAEITSKEGRLDNETKEFIFYGSSKLIKNKNENSSSTTGKAEKISFLPQKDQISLKGSSLLETKKFLIEADEIYLDFDSMKIIKSTELKMKTKK